MEEAITNKDILGLILSYIASDTDKKNLYNLLMVSKLWYEVIKTTFASKIPKELKECSYSLYNVIRVRYNDMTDIYSSDDNCNVIATTFTVDIRDNLPLYENYGFECDYSIYHSLSVSFETVSYMPKYYGYDYEELDTENEIPHHITITRQFENELEIKLPIEALDNINLCKYRDLKLFDLKLGLTSDTYINPKYNTEKNDIVINEKVDYEIFIRNKLAKSLKMNIRSYAYDLDLEKIYVVVMYKYKTYSNDDLIITKGYYINLAHDEFVIC